MSKLDTLRELMSMISDDAPEFSSHWQIGANYLIRTVTHIQNRAARCL